MDAFEAKLPVDEMKKIKSQAAGVWRTLNEDNISFSVRISFVNLALVLLGMISVFTMCKIVKCACRKKNKACKAEKTASETAK